MTVNQRISREDLEKRFASLQEDFQGKLENKKQTVVAAAVGSVVLMLLSYLFGRRRGSRRSTRVQFRQK
jgi:hypothetical protein